MKYKRIVPFLAGLTLLVSSFLPARDIKVGKDKEADYLIIQEAVDISEKGDRIFVGEGTFIEKVRVDGKRDLELTGSGAKYTTITGDDYNGFYGAIEGEGMLHKFGYTPTQMRWTLGQLSFTNIQQGEPTFYPESKRMNMRFECQK